MTVNDEGNNVRFLTKSETNGKISEMVMLVKGKDEIVVLDMTGSIDLSTISKIIQINEYPWNGEPSENKGES